MPRSQNCGCTGRRQIVPEPIEEFADEPGGTPISVPQITSRPTLERIPLPPLEPDLPLIPRTVPLAERPLLIRPPVEPPPIYYPSRPGQNRGPDAAPDVPGDGHARLRGGVRVDRGDALSARRRNRDGGSGSTGRPRRWHWAPPSAAAPAPDSTPPTPLRPAQLQTADVARATLPDPSRPLSRPDAQRRVSEVRASRAPEPPTNRVDSQKQTRTGPTHT